jgi:predicted RNA-binding Zn-ribbon protein involved in translation (DUF1610 family)
MKIERLQMSIQTVKENIAILESQEPEDAGYYLQLEHEKMVLEALEKQVPKRPIEDGYNDEPAVCPNCGESIIKLLDNDYRIQYCICCGQALDFTDHPTEKGGEG